MLVEPPRARAPRRPHALLKPSPARLAALAAATALAASSRGDVLLLGVALAVAAGGPVAAVGAVGALAGSALRWGTTSLGAIAGAQAVLGPAGWTGGVAAVASAWVGAAALVLAAPDGRGTGLPPRLEPLAAVPFGLAAALVVVGPAPGGAIALRVVAAVVATGLVLGRARVVPIARLAPAAAALGVLAVVLGALGA